MRSRNNGGVIGAYAAPTQNFANGVFFIHDAAIYNTGSNPIWPLATGFIYSATGGTIANANITYDPLNANYKTHTFTSNGTFTITNGSGPLEIFMVGGGGAGGCVNGAYLCGGGGGGGEVGVISTWINGPTTFTVEVGATVSYVTSTVCTYISAKPSKVTSTAGHNYTALGGGCGGAVGTLTTVVSTSLMSGGSGGGSGAYYNAGVYTPGTATGSYFGYAGGAASSTASPNHVAGGGGGGATEAGYSALYSFVPRNASKGGDGYQWSRTGLYYGAGGGGGRMYNNLEGIAYNEGARAGLSVGGGYSGGTGYWSSSVSSSFNGSSPSSGYGSGGGGSATGSGGGIYSGGSGGSGTIIFCYRYK